MALQITKNAVVADQIPAVMGLFKCPAGFLTAVQALTGLFGTVLAIYGRLNAASPLTLRKG